MTKQEKITKAKTAIKEFKTVVAQNWIAIEFEKRREKPDQKKIDTCEFNTKDAEQYIKWTQDILKSLG